MTKEEIFAEVEKALGPLDEKTKRAIELAMDLMERKTEPTHELRWQGENPSFEEAMKLSLEERSRILDELEALNKLWLEQRCRELGAHWLVVVDGQVVAYGSPGLQGLEIDKRIANVGQQTGKFPLVFIHPMALAIEESLWQATNIAGDFYPTLPVALENDGKRLSFLADFDTGAYGFYADAGRLERDGLISLQTGERLHRAFHLNASYTYIVRTMTVSLIAESEQRQTTYDIVCVLNWYQSPFVIINPNREALVGRDLCLSLKPQVNLNFAQHQTTVHF